MNIQNLKLDFLYYRKAEGPISLDKERHPTWYHEQYWQVKDFIESASTFEIIELLIIAFHNKYPDHGELQWKLGGEYKDEGHWEIAGRNDRHDITDMRWKIFEDEHYSKKWKVNLTYKFHLQEVVITFDKPLAEAKDNVIRGLGDKQYQYTSTGDKQVFTVTESPIAKVELEGNKFRLVVNEDYAENYLEAREMLEE